MRPRKQIHLVLENQTDTSLRARFEEIGIDVRARIFWGLNELLHRVLFPVYNLVRKGLHD